MGMLIGVFSLIGMLFTGLLLIDIALFVMKYLSFLLAFIPIRLSVFFYPLYRKFNQHQPKTNKSRNFTNVPIDIKYINESLFLFFCKMERKLGSTCERILYQSQEQTKKCRGEDAVDNSPKILNNKVIDGFDNSSHAVDSSTGGEGNQPNNTSNEQGLTLLELLVAMFLIGVITAIIVPVCNNLPY